MSQTTIAGALLNDAPSLTGLLDAHPGLRIITRSNAEYDALRQGFNFYNNTTEPLAIILPEDEIELAGAVKYCTSLTPHVPLTVRSGGHDMHGRYILEGAILLDVSQVNHIRVSPDRQAVTIGPGVRGLALLQALEPQGLTANVGWCGQVGVTGWASGGGYGVGVGLWGMGVDNILGARVITPGPGAGKVVDTDDDPELLWAIRGAGLGNFGVITELRLKVHERPRQLAGLVVFPLAEAREVLLDGLQSLRDEGKLPANFNAEFTVGNTPGIGPTVSFLWSWICESNSDASVERGWKFHREFKELGTVLLDTVAETTMCAYHEFLDPLLATGGYHHFNSAASSRLTPELIQVLLDNPPPEKYAGSAILFHHSHHQATRPNLLAAFAIREDHYLWGVNGAALVTSTPEEQEESRRWPNKIYEGIVGSGSTSDKGYWSFSRPEHADAVKYFGEEAVDRLRVLKEKYNPGNALPQAYPVL
ncbi:FAD binding domain protein [Apodospora peruviana]|uniref:FAD binding domain protein n=1 Tax=Apodospora peruviana TaxID=516989 RepID=A0AAE0IIA6_9PEZI|nr:FAD binding domain protein [Apodospora peruviana]